MKKLLIGLGIFVVLVALVLTGCSQVMKIKRKNRATTTAVMPEVYAYMSDEGYLHKYWSEVSEMKNIDSELINELRGMRFENNVYKPIRINGKIIYVDNKTGALKMVEKDYSTTLAISAHTDNDEEIIRSNSNLAMTYSKDDAKVQTWIFGEVVDEYTVPAGAIYCGYSDSEGYIFRDNNDVYAIKETDEDEIIPIAHNVKYVVETNYKLESDSCCQPLFIMTDGSIKTYCSWIGDDKDITDSSSHLIDITKDAIEGGYGH